MKMREYSGDGERLLGFLCPGCGYEHCFRIAGQPGRPLWEWDGRMDVPTFSPSLRVNAGCEDECHLFLREGKIQFLDDCHHALAGQTVDMVEIDGDTNDHSTGS